MEVNKNKKTASVKNAMVEITLNELSFNELNLDEMCELFEDLALAFGYRFKDGWGISYTRLDE